MNTHSFSSRGIPIVDHATKVRYLRECIEDDSEEDAVGHLWDLVCADPALRSLSSRDAVVDILTRHAPDLNRKVKSHYYWQLDEAGWNSEFARFGEPTPISA